MIGQRELLKRIDGQIERDKFPRFTILIGEKGSGKKLLAKNISNKLHAPLCCVEHKADSIREMIDLAYKAELPIIYLIADCDSMSSASANAILKVTEEPPRNAYFILTCENLDNLLPTIKSRGVTYMLEPYSYEDKCDYVDTIQEQFADDIVEFVLDIASNIGECKELLNIDLKAFIDYVNLVIDNIAEVSGSNAFKIADKIALKDESDKYNLRLFWKAFRAICVDRMSSGDAIKFARAVALTGDYLQQLSIKGINRQMLFDAWMLDIRNEWYYDYGC